MFYDNYERLCSSVGKSPNAVAALVGITSTGTVTGWKNGATPQNRFLLRIAEYFNVTVDGLLADNDTKTILSLPESTLIKKYRALDEHGRKLVDTVLDIESERFEETVPDNIVELRPNKTVPLFESSFAAGWGDPSFGNPWTDYEVPEDSKAEFAIRINGDSMEPQLKDGSIALCQKRAPKDGEVGAFLLDGSYICKQVCVDITGTLHLFSLNRARRNMDQHIAADDIASRLMCFGTVMMKKQPLPLD